MSRRRLVHLMPRMPWPPDDGGRIGLWQFIRATSRAFECTAAILAEPDEALDTSPIEALGVGVRIVRHRRPSAPVALLRGAAGRWPYTITRYWSRNTFRQIREIAKHHEPEVVMLHHLHLAPYADAFPDSVVVLRAHNVESVWMQRLAGAAKNPLEALYIRLQARRMRKTEAERCAACDLVLAVQEQEATFLRSMNTGTRVETVPVAIDLDAYGVPAPSGSVALLAGAWSWAPNADGAVRFIQQGWPSLRAQCPRARLRLVGKGIPRRLSDAARDAGVDVVGYVADMREAFASAGVLVVPLWVGAGARVKIIEALAARVAVVSTPLGAEGLGLESGRNVVLNESPSGLGDAAGALLQDPARMERIAAAGRHMAERTFARDVVDRNTVRLLNDALEDRMSRARTEG